MADPADDSLENLSPEDLGLLKVAKELANDPATRANYLRLVKHKYPNQPIPELDVEARMEKFAEAPLKELAELKKSLIERDVREKIESERRTLRDAGYSTEDVTAIEKLMTEKAIPSHATAAEHFRMTRQLATPTPSTLERTGTNTLPIDREAVKKAGGIRKWGREEAYRAADDLKSGRVKLH